MPLMNSMGALKEQNMVTSVIGGNQYIVTVTGTNSPFFMPSETGNAYFQTDNSMGITKVDSNGNVLFQKSATGGLGSLYVHSDNTVYQLGTISSRPAIIQYNNAGNVTWEKSVQTGSFSGVGELKTDSGGNVYAIIVATGSSPMYSIVKFNGGGTLQAQKHILNATSEYTKIGIDSVNQQLIVSGTDTSGAHSNIVNGIYPWSFTSSVTTNTMLVQSSASDNYSSFGQTISDGTYIYQLGLRTISSTNYYVYMKINQSTGAIVYSKQITFGAYNVQLRSVCQDTYGYMYVAGLSLPATDNSDYGFIAKIRKSDGYIMWSKTIYNSYKIYECTSINWSNRFIYFTTTIAAAPTFQYNGHFKLKDDGSLPNGTYATYFTINKVTTSTTTVNSSSTSTTTDSQSTTSYTANTVAVTNTTSSYTMTTTLIP